MLTLLSASCATEISNVTCPALVGYDKEFQKRAAEQLHKLSDEELKTLLNDYMKLRKACKSLKDD